MRREECDEHRRIAHTMRLTFPYDWLLEQVLDGRKTASVLRPGERNYGTDPRDDEVRVGGEYDACDTRGEVRCRIRVTEMRELCWGEAIPERLWRAEACANEEEFRRDHHEWFSRPGPEYTFRAFWFERIATLLVLLCTALAGSGVPSTAAAGTGVGPPPVSADTSPSASSTPQLRLANEREVLDAVVRTMLATGRVADGTVFAGVRLSPDGSVAELLDFYGAAYAASPELAQLLRAATARARFTSAGGSLPATWAVFWVLQPNACRPWTYDAPAHTTVIRVCIDVKDGRADPWGTYYVIDALPSPWTAPADGVKFKAQRVIPYPADARRRGRTAELVVRLTVDDASRIVAYEVVENTGGAEFATWARDWMRTLAVELPPAAVPAGGTRSYDVGVAFQITGPNASECVFVLPDMPGLVERVRVCAGRATRR